MTAKISAGTVVTANSRMEVWQPGYVIVRDNRIAEAGPGHGPDGDFDERIDATTSIVMPGLVNGHSHSPSNLLKGTWAGLPLEIWRQYIRAGWREYSDEAVYVSAQLGIVEMIRTGCTSVMDHFYTGSPLPHMGALNVVEAMADAGMRGGLALTLSDMQYEATVETRHQVHVGCREAGSRAHFAARRHPVAGRFSQVRRNGAEPHAPGAADRRPVGAAPMHR